MPTTTTRRPPSPAAEQLLAAALDYAARAGTSFRSDRA